MITTVIFQTAVPPDAVFGAAASWVIGVLATAVVALFGLWRKESADHKSSIIALTDKCKEQEDAINKKWRDVYHREDEKWEKQINRLDQKNDRIIEIQTSQNQVLTNVLLNLNDSLNELREALQISEVKNDKGD